MNREDFLKISFAFDPTKDVDIPPPLSNKDRYAVYKIKLALIKYDEPVGNNYPWQFSK